MRVFIASVAFILLEQKTNLNHLKKGCGNEDIFTIVIHSEETKILKFNQ